MIVGILAIGVMVAIFGIVIVDLREQYGRKKCL